MKMTVGPLPANVYWRRRAIVGGAILIIAVLLWASCGSSDPDSKRTSSAASGDAPTSATAAPTVTIQVPTTGDPAPAPTSAPPSAAAPASVAPVSSTVPPCADADLSVVAASEQSVQFRGAYLKFTLKIKNVTTHDCMRDLGADSQELYLTVGAVKMWSSDDCNAPHGTAMTLLKPSIEQSFQHAWNGKATNGGCASPAVPPAGKYGLVGRLGTKISEPVQVQLT